MTLSHLDMDFIKSNDAKIHLLKFILGHCDIDVFFPINSLWKQFWKIEKLNPQQPF